MTPKTLCCAECGREYTLKDKMCVRDVWMMPVKVVVYRCPCTSHRVFIFQRGRKFI